MPILKHKVVPSWVDLNSSTEDNLKNWISLSKSQEGSNSAFWLSNLVSYLSTLTETETEVVGKVLAENNKTPEGAALYKSAILANALPRYKDENENVQKLRVDESLVFKDDCIVCDRLTDAASSMPAYSVKIVAAMSNLLQVCEITNNFDYYNLGDSKKIEVALTIASLYSTEEVQQKLKQQSYKIETCNKVRALLLMDVDHDQLYTALYG